MTCPYKVCWFCLFIFFYWIPSQAGNNSVMNPEFLSTLLNFAQEAGWLTDEARAEIRVDDKESYQTFLDQFVEKSWWDFMLDLAKGSDAVVFHHVRLSRNEIARKTPWPPIVEEKIDPLFWAGLKLNSRFQDEGRDSFMTWLKKFLVPGLRGFWKMTLISKN